jgi:glutathione S-transferase
MITFYDITGSLPGKAWSPNTWKTRLALNFKGIPYHTEWLEYPEIEPLCKRIGAPPTGTKKTDGTTPHYTLPVIKDDSTGAVISDSWNIAVYLDKTYPDLPLLFPGGTKPLQAAFENVWLDALMTHGMAVFLPRVPEVALNPPSAEYFIRTRSADFGKPLAEVAPTGTAKEKHFSDWQKQLSKAARLYGLSDGPFLLGETVSYADLIAGSFALWMKMTATPEDWAVLGKWHDGLLSKVAEGVEKYKKVD